MTATIIATGFNGVQFQEITRNNEPWIRGYQVGTALGYTNPDVAIRKIYDRHADEFTDSMTAVVTLPTPGGLQETRIFSLRGCHLLAMFARTSVAKAFRVWVLDVLETLNKSQGAEHPALDTDTRLSKRGDPERKELHALVNTWVGCAPLHYAAVNAIINAHIGVKGVDEMTIVQVKAAIEFARGKIAEAMKPQEALLPSANVDLVALPTRQESLSAALRIKALNPGPGNSGEFYEGELLRVFQDFVKWRKEVLAQVDAMEKEFSAVTSPLFRDVLHKLMADTPLYVTDIGMWAMCESRDDAAKAIRDGVNKWECLFTKAQWFAKTLRVRW